MAVKDNVLLHYSAATFAVTLAATLALGLLLAGNLTTYLLRTHVETFPPVVALAFREDPDTEAWFAAGKPVGPPASLESRLRGLLGLGQIFRIKVWAADGTILWSDEPSLVGQILRSTEMLEALATRRPAYEEGHPDGTENAAEQGRGRVLQVYTPILRQGQALGVIELYEANRDLYNQIAVTTRDVWGLVLAFGLGLYGLLFFVFFRAYRNQKKAHHELEMTQEATVFALAYQAELRDRETGAHLERTARYVGLLAEALGCPTALRGELVRAAPLHDIGKVGIPDAILLKPGPLTPGERAVMETHCALGDSVLAEAEKKLPFRSFLATAREMVLCHHEKWDGTGYPGRMSGDRIPLAGRIMALADVYDALRSRRPYKEPLGHRETAGILVGLSGTHFDPRVVEAFRAAEDGFRRISES